MRFLLSFRHPLSEKYTDVEIEADTVQSAKYQTSNYMKGIGVISWIGHKWRTAQDRRFGCKYTKKYDLWFKNGEAHNVQVRLKAYDISPEGRQNENNRKGVI